MPGDGSGAVTRRGVVLGAVGVAGAAALPGGRAARAQQIAGGRPVRVVVPYPAGGAVDLVGRWVVVPYPAGGAVDLVGRLLAERMEPALGQQVVVDNRTGAAGIVGADSVAKARPDGTTLGVIGMTTLCAYKTLYNRLPFDPDKDFTPVSQISAGTVVCCVNKDAQRKNGWTDFRRLMAWVRDNPDALRFGTAGVGTTAHFTMAAIQKATGTKALMVTYRGGAPAVADLQAGVIDMMFELTPGLMPLIEQGVVSPLAVGSAKRVGALPEVPGMAEFADIGLGGVDIGAWEALMAPAGTPADVAERLNAAVRQASADPGMREKLRASGFAVETSESPAALAAKIQSEIPYWRKLVEDSGAKLDT